MKKINPVGALVLLSVLCLAQSPPAVPAPAVPAIEGPVIGLFGEIPYTPAHVYTGSINYGGHFGGSFSFSEHIGKTATYMVMGTDIHPSGSLKKFSISTVPWVGIEQILFESKDGKNIFTIHGGPGVELPDTRVNALKFAGETGFKYFRKVTPSTAIKIGLAYAIVPGKTVDGGLVINNPTSLSLSLGVSHATK